MKWPILCLLWTFTIPAATAQTYFQQRVDTKIDVRLDDQRHYLHGFETFTYNNHSGDTLRYIYLHLWPNAYLHDRTVFTDQQIQNNSSTFYYSKQEDRGFIDSLDVHIDGQKVSLFSSDKTPDIARIDLPVALLPGASFVFSTPFRVKIPKVFSRMGHSKQAYYISQWFPKPAVYDHKGWHPLPYTDQGEFYSEIGSYDVSITLPQNYVVMATGNCLDEPENNWLDSLSRQPLPGFSFPATAGKHWRDSINRIPKSAAAFKTIRFHEDNIHDFAWFADKRFVIRKDSFLVAGRNDRITAYTAFLPTSKKAWLKVNDYSVKTVQQLSEAVGPYPYKTVKVVEGDMKAGGGMEYPTVTVIDRSLNGSTLMDVVVHEVGHNWFYGILATNERDLAWMDEGVNTFYERKITRQLQVDTEYDDSKSLINQLEALLYYEAVATGTDQSLKLTASKYTKLNYGADVYLKTGLLLEWLEGYMGKADFRKGMQSYFANWKHRHPSPADLQNSLQQHTGKPLNWFFKEALTTNRPIDFSLKKVQTTADSTFITVKNRSAFDAPVRINAYKKHQLTDSLWTNPFSGTQTFSLAGSNADQWRIGSEIPDFKSTNNNYTKKGLLHGRGIRAGFGYGWNRSDKEPFYLFPAAGYNVYDGFMAGLLIHNLSFPDKNLRFILAPVYGFRSKDPAGAGSIGYFIHPRRTFREILIQTDVKRFNYEKTDYNTPSTIYSGYLKIAPSVSFVLKNTMATDPVTRKLTLKGYAINEQYQDYYKNASDSIATPHAASQQLYYGLMRYQHRNDRLFNPFSYTAEAQLGKEFVKLTLEGNVRIDYNTRGKSLYIRGFAGKFISLDNTPFGTSRYWLNTTYSGVNDYLYDETYIGRSERDDFASRQVSVKEGGLAVPTNYYASPLGRSDDWLASVNIKTDLPLGKLPVRLFLDIATFSNAKNMNPSGDRYLYQAGAEIHLLYDIVLIHIPFILSKDYNDYLKSIHGDKQFSNSISFTLQLKKINWLRTTQGGLKLLML